jgi:hypothetical protein
MVYCTITDLVAVLVEKQSLKNITHVIFKQNLLRTLQFSTLIPNQPSNACYQVLTADYDRENKHRIE